MGYKKAEEVLPQELIELIQKYVDGENIYIPRKKNRREKWGNKTKIREELRKRNDLIFKDFQQGYRIEELALKYFLSEKSIQRIIHEMKKAS